MRKLIVALMLLSTVLPAARALAEPVAVEVANARQFEIASSVTGERLRVLVWQPPGSVPEKGFPVLYAFDGDESFGMLTDVAAATAPAARRAGLAPAMVVAVAYPPGDGSIERRTYDYTPKAESYVMPERPNGQPWPKLGGGDDFLATIEKDVKPLVNGGFPVDQTAETLFGHSLGGLMTLHALMTRPDAFDRYFVSSPSLWVNDRKALRDMEAFLKGDGAAKAPVPLRLTVGTEEETLSAWDRLSYDDIAVRERWTKGNSMIGNTRDLAALIEAQGGEVFDFGFAMLEGFDHGGARATAAQRAIRFAIDGQ